MSRPDTRSAAVGSAAAPDILRPRAEDQYAAELVALTAHDNAPRPPNWRLSPRSVVTYLSPVARSPTAR
jgi:hypothetical protein